MTLPILFYTMAFSICFNGRNTLFRCWKHFVSMGETLCFYGRNKLKTLFRDVRAMIDSNPRCYLCMFYLLFVHVLFVICVAG